MAGAAMVALSGCSGTDLTGVGDGGLGNCGLEQHVTLRHMAAVAVGDSFTVRSVIVNRGRTPVTVVLGTDNALQFSGVAFVTRSDPNFYHGHHC